ncbi:LOW QUALITY PROTEIN: uncharacterized protein B0I36DRAFT_375553 [Microdochium trichocladiopsis]|uniref:Rad4 transglutaminase-like domain-domain-containing protein n=1 Tax=Microdochium trichocladiopsis TaxID=1682393 RepID=A0A9P8Y2H3_9PEZI|nr:LOW QUALITY PROTEIN: uncharacterized protein B0I36DRAFT_375553 [Microdochium trichocladiopsis]KAH7027901.1 LOW QUALITY PROTEIN: hypothetical protein B0I36DRAFT_375553 [Microdochium trichocladiopsis]
MQATGRVRTETVFSERSVRKSLLLSAAAAGATASRSNGAGVPDIYRDMLVAADIAPSEPERPLKKRRPPGARRPELSGPGPASKAAAAATAASKGRREPQRIDDKTGAGVADNDSDESDSDEIEFEDVALPDPTIQTMERDSDEEEDDDEDEEPIQFEDVDLTLMNSFGLGDVQEEEKTPKVLELDLAAAQSKQRRQVAERRKPINREEKDRRIVVHKTHLLCLLAHVSQRNRWCNDPVTQRNLRPLLSSKTIDYLNPSTELTQFGRTNSLKRGLEDVMTKFKTRYKITERGMRRALWAEKEEHLKNYQLPDDIETPPEKSDFREMATTLEGSRDVGAQLFCALLRSAGVEARLVCSLQPLACTPGAPPMGKPPKSRGRLSLEEQYARIPKYDSSFESPVAAPSPLSARRRLGHPNAAAFNAPVMTGPVASSSSLAPQKIRESPFPIYWVEVLDEAHQKWQPVDPIVTESFWRPQKLEPPANDRENCMTYVVAFEADGTARDVTRRYAKAYNAKTRKMRVESVGDRGDRWWRKALRAYSRDYATDMDQIESNELNNLEAREPMPRNVADFKDHPVYALERHLRRNEVLVPGASAAGTVGAGSTGPLEKIYRRRDVRVARTREKWYRMGRTIRENEIPVKFVPKRVRKDNLFGGDDDDDDDDDDDESRMDDTGAAAGNPLYTIEQTELYKAPPVVDGRVPKNRFGNLDVYVPSMVPEGGAYVADEYGARAAFMLGIDYAPALTGFQFRGRQGTAVLHGVVVPAENEDAVRAVIEGLKDEEAEFARAMRSREVLRAWKRMLMNLRRIWAGVGSDDDEEEAQQASKSQHNDYGHDMAVDGHDVGDAEADEDDDTQGGFMREAPSSNGHGEGEQQDLEVDLAADSDEEEGGGFMIDDDYAGGFIVE